MHTESDTYTETLKMVSSDAAFTRQQIAAWGRALDVTIEDVVEDKRRGSTLMTVTVSGSAEQLEEFRSSVVPSPRGGGGDWLTMLLAPMGDAAFDGVARWRRNRRRKASGPSDSDPAK